MEPSLIQYCNISGYKKADFQSKQNPTCLICFYCNILLSHFFQLRVINLNKFTSCYNYYYNEKSPKKVMLTNQNRNKVI